MRGLTWSTNRAASHAACGVHLTGEMNVPALAWWIVVGAGAGWVATTSIGTGQARRPFIELVVGVVGALLTGLLCQTLLVGAQDHVDSATIVAAVAGACVLLALWRWVSRPKPQR